MLRVASGLVAVLLLFSSPAAAGALDQFEKAHRPSEERKSTESSSEGSSSSDDDDDDDLSGFDDDAASTGDGSSDGDGAGWGLVVVCAIPPLSLVCIHPSHRLARSVYDDQGLYIEPLGDRSEDVGFEPTPRTYLDRDLERMRIAELSLSGFRAFNEPVVYTHDLELRLWLGQVVVGVGWEHFYERIVETNAWDHLDLLRGRLGANVLGPYVDFMEAYLSAGVLVMHGEEWTPAFDAQLDLRVYPIEPLAVHGVAAVSVFGIGPVLLDATLDAGVALGPIEIRLGPRWLYQHGAQGFWGPMATLVGRM